MEYLFQKCNQAAIFMTSFTNAGTNQPMSSLNLFMKRVFLLLDYTMINLNRSFMFSTDGERESIRNIFK